MSESKWIGDSLSFVQILIWVPRTPYWSGEDVWACVNHRDERLFGADHDHVTCDNTIKKWSREDQSGFQSISYRVGGAKEAETKVKENKKEKPKQTGNALVSLWEITEREISHAAVVA